MAKVEEKKMRQYELKAGCGPHLERDSESGEQLKYEPGDVIHTDRDMKALFPHKWRELGINKPATPKNLKGRERTSEEEEDDRDKKQLIADKKALKEEGSNGNEVPDDEDEDEDEDEDLDDGEDEAAPVKSKFGKDVTKKFEAATKADLKVFYSKKKGHTIVDSDEPGKLLAQREKAKDVEKWLADYRKG